VHEHQPALSKQVAGTHYKQLKIQVVEYVHANKLDAFQFSIVKYATRHKDKGGAADLRKAIHWCELALEMQYGESK
jgi:hypothetical protein